MRASGGVGNSGVDSGIRFGCSEWRRCPIRVRASVVGSGRVVTFHVKRHDAPESRHGMGCVIGSSWYWLSTCDAPDGRQE